MDEMKELPEIIDEAYNTAGDIAYKFAMMPSTDEYLLPQSLKLIIK